MPMHLNLHTVKLVAEVGARARSFAVAQCSCWGPASLLSASPPCGSVLSPLLGWGARGAPARSLTLRGCGFCMFLLLLKGMVNGIVIGVTVDGYWFASIWSGSPAIPQASYIIGLSASRVPVPWVMFFPLASFTVMVDDEHLDMLWS